MQKSPYNNQGFTLLEIMIAITILAVISIFTATSMQNTITLKRKIQTKIDSSTEIRSAIKVIKKDIQTAFNYNNYNLELLVDIRREIILDKQQKNQQSNANNNNSTNNNQQKKTNTNDPNQVTTESIIGDYISAYKNQQAKTHFMGEKDSLHFTSLNHLRRFKDAQESNIMEVGYYLENCRSLLKANERSQCLWRRTTPFIDEDTTEGGSGAVLLENISKLEMTFYDAKAEEWLTRWLSNEDGSQTTRNRFPSAVKLKLELEVGGQAHTEELIIGLFFTNNKNDDKKDSANPTDGAPNQQGN